MVNDERFVTEEGVSKLSTFKEIRENYSIKKIITSINNVVVLLKDSDLYFTIDKKELPESLRYNANSKIEEVQIPDNAKVKYMMVGWD
jgi:soluble P-type ATPase